MEYPSIRLPGPGSGISDVDATSRYIISLPLEDGRCLLLRPGDWVDASGDGMNLASGYRTLNGGMERWW